MTLLTVGSTTGRLELRPPWSLAAGDLAGPADGPDAVRWLERARAEAARLGALDLRLTTALPGSTPLTPREHVVPVPIALPDAGATRALGRRLAAGLRPGDLVVLSGPLGAGKTTLTQGLAEGLGVRGPVTSPTFVLARTHPGPVPLLHVDAYRLRPAGDDARHVGADRPDRALGQGGWDRSAWSPHDLDLDDLGLDAALEDAVTVVEWGEGLVERLADDRLLVRLDRDSGADQRRTAVVVPVGPRWAVRSSG